MRFRRPNRPHLVRLELTAMIDVIFLLIIFFMTTAQFVQQSLADVDLPEEAGQEEVVMREPALVINVLREGATPFVVGEKMMDTAGVLDLIDREIARLQMEGKSAADLEVIIRADRKGFARVINELGIHMKKRGVTHWRLATQPPQG